MEFVLVQGGVFQMGDIFNDDEYDNEKPVHEVELDDFYIGKYPVTQAEWLKILQENLSRFKGDRNPVESVSWYDTQRFIEELNRQSGRQYRLPTEAEWEYAARERGRKVRFGNGQDIITADTANFNASEVLTTKYSKAGEFRGKTTPVGSFPGNALGLYDMSGNVWEWCADWYDENYYTSSPRNNPQGPDQGESRVLRGGYWESRSEYVRVAARRWGAPDARYWGGGFRLVLSARRN
jgi:formylglycine-generating enzyme required for sulfatase activity